MGKLAIFASGSGTNADAIINFFRHSNHQVVLVLTNNAKAGVLEVAKKSDIPTHYLKPKLIADHQHILSVLKDHEVDFIALAGYLKKIPSELVRQYEGRMLNIHPSLLPNFGGKGMYGMKVHEAVLEQKELVSGITIHQVNEVYDQGDIVFQAACGVSDCELASEIGMKVRKLEHKYYPKIVELMMAHSQVN